MQVHVDACVWLNHNNTMLDLPHHKFHRIRGEKHYVTLSPLRIFPMSIDRREQQHNSL